MPKYLKDTKIEYWTETPGGPDSEGIWQDGEKVKVADLWANARGKNMTEYYAHNRMWPAPILEFVFTRPAFAVELSDHIRYKGTFYKIANIDELTGHPHSDIKITCEFDKLFTV